MWLLPYIFLFLNSRAPIYTVAAFSFSQTDCLAKALYKFPLFSSAEAEIQKSFHSMLVSPAVFLIALISQSSFVTGILVSSAGASDALHDGTHPLEPCLVPLLQTSPTHPGGNSPNIIRGLLFKRQLTCPSGYGLCSDGFCCPNGSSCCSGTIFNWPPLYE
jgi:hypothetical protein